MKPQSTPETASAAEGAQAAFCTMPGAHTLRLIQERYDFILTYNKIAHLGEHEFAEQITIMQNGVKRGSLEVTSITAAPDLTEADFAITTRVIDPGNNDYDIPGKVFASKILTKTQPVYPPQAREKHISGSVVLSAMIGEDGTVKDLDVASSPSPILTDAAMDAVKHWTYQPYLMNGVRLR